MKTTNQIDIESNELKARKIIEQYETRYNDTRDLLWEDLEDIALQAMECKDEERKELWRITRNHYQEWAIEQITAFAQHLNKCGAFREDLCMDFEHEAQTFIEYQNK